MTLLTRLRKVFIAAGRVLLRAPAIYLDHKSTTGA